MFIFTAKFNRKRAIAAVIVLGLILGAVILLAGARDGAGETILNSSGIKTNADRVRFLGDCGWSVSELPVDEQEVLIPKEFGTVYESYARLQSSQGFDLAGYAGLEAMRYTYEVLNYPGFTEGVVADIIVYRGKVIAGDVQSLSLGGFMHGLCQQPKAE